MQKKAEKGLAVIINEEEATNIPGLEFPQWELQRTCE